MSDSDKIIDEVVANDYKYGFTTNIEQEFAQIGLSEETVRYISAKKGRTGVDARMALESFSRLAKNGATQVAERSFSRNRLPKHLLLRSPEKEKGYQLTGGCGPRNTRSHTTNSAFPFRSRKCWQGVAVDYVMDSESVITTFRESLKEKGVIFCSISEAVREHPELVKQYLGTVVPQRDNFYAALNSAVFSDGSFVYIPKGVRCPMELSTYFRINAENTGQFERTLIIADEGSYVSILRRLHRPHAR
jgi:Fe-S cluster assembly protein SufB